jgi:hypothetical protein
VKPASEVAVIAVVAVGIVAAAAARAFEVEPEGFADIVEWLHASILDYWKWLMHVIQPVLGLIEGWQIDMAT